ncbi:MAG: C4-dicarboxylate ABC transporter permease [Rhodospirillaceae bacterium]|nr:C4-dicarboxylate ABC transporter permease [Rhodospirillaceae bacterium]
MEWSSALLLMFGGYILLMTLSLPVAFAFFGINLVGAFVFLGGDIGLMQFTRNTKAALTTITLAPIPLFLLMGEILFHTGLAIRAIDAIDRLISRVPGRLSIVSITGGTIFATLSGSTLANAAVLGSTLMPDMVKRGYHPSLAMGPIMAVGGIAMLIPPSALAVLLGSLAKIPITHLLIAGIIPGFMMSFAFLAYVIGRSVANPALAPAYDVEVGSVWDRWRPFLINVVPLLGIFVVVIGSIMGGLASPTESAALGCTASVAAAIAYRSFTWAGLLKALTETAKITVMIFFIIAASITFSQILTFSGASAGLLETVQSLGASPMVILISMIVFLLILGAFMDQISMMMLTIPFYMPIASAVGIDPLWLGVLMLIVMEIGLITPPFGLILYVMKGVAPEWITLGQVWVAAVPFIAIEITVLLIILVAPGVATWLPRLILS